MNKIINLLLIIVGIILIIIGLFLMINPSDKKLDLEFGENVNVTYTFDETLVDYTADTLPSEYNNYDFDGDGLKNKDEIIKGTDLYKVDTDMDGISDSDEIKNTNTDPLKWSSRDDGKSDLEFVITNNKNFKEGYSELDSSGFRVYLKTSLDNLFIISKTKIDLFDDLETVSEVYQIKNFNGKMALDCSKYVKDVVNSISIYKIVDGKAKLVDTVVDDNNLISFDVIDGDIFCAVYSGE